MQFYSPLMLQFFLTNGLCLYHSFQYFIPCTMFNSVHSFPCTFTSLEKIWPITVSSALCLAHWMWLRNVCEMNIIKKINRMRLSLSQTNAQYPIRWRLRRWENYQVKRELGKGKISWRKWDFLGISHRMSGISTVGKLAITMINKNDWQLPESQLLPKLYYIFLPTIYKEIDKGGGNMPDWPERPDYF